MDVIASILNIYPKLKGASRKIADFILADPESFLISNASQLGKKTHTSPATIVRFCQQVGFKGLKDFKIALAQSVPKDDEAEVEMIVDSHDNPAVIARKLQKNLNKNESQLMTLLDDTSLNQAVSLLRKADRVLLEGIGASGIAAMDLYYKLIRSGKAVYYNQDPHIALERAYYSQKNDVMIVFSYSGLTKEVLLAAQSAQRNGTPVIAVTRLKETPLASLADVVLQLPDNEKLLRVGAINSLFSEMFISSLLFLAMINSDLSTMEKNYQRTEKLTNRLKEANTKNMFE